MIERVKDKNRGFFDRWDWLAFWASLGVALVVYLFSLGPSIGLEDAGELVVAADVMGVPHPPGYPLWTLLSWGFCRLFAWVTWQGYPNPAWAVAFASAVMGALATGLTALLITRSGRDVLAATTNATPTTIARASWLSGVTASLTFAFSPVMWSQAVIPEVYALGAFFLAMVLLLTYRWMQRPRRATLVWLGFMFGLGLTNYQVLLLAGLPIAFILAVRRWALAKSFLAVLIPLGLTAYLLKLGALPSADALSTPGAPVILRPEGASPWWVYNVCALGILSAAVLAWRKPLTWSNPSALKRFLVPMSICGGCLLLSAEIVAPYTLPEGFEGTLYPFFNAWAVHLLALGGLWWICRSFRRSRAFAMVVTIAQLTLLCLLQQGLLLGLTHPTTGWFWWGFIWMLLLLLLAGRLLLQGRTVAWVLLAGMAGLTVYVYMPLASDLLNPAMNWGYARTWEGFTRAISRGQYEALEPSLFFSSTYWQQLLAYGADLRMQFSLPTLTLAVVGTVLLVWQTRLRRYRLGLLWFSGTVGFFIVMSAVLIALANPSGDLQDGFIQKVKFIASHGIFALWIGYGLLFLLCRLQWTRWLVWALPLIPLYANFTNDRLVLAMGGAEQTGHDYGWQFGAYMLNGAPTIRAELSADEEPLPDPFYPPPMEENALFFGGTDPGRFVPTYMVFSANFRPDIFVFTQNALADPTYMNVQRDLYGDHLWVPTADEVLNTFSHYVNAVQRGERSTRGQIQEENGRVRITGPSAIMDINAILAKRLYTMNEDHACYIEESYALPWMTPFLEPAGLAMRVQRAPVSLSETQRHQDADFWDWMTRRLVHDEGYRRDFAAQKSFSKLRTSIARLYTRRQERAPAAKAFRDALALYPWSPEVLFLYLREELLLPSETLKGAIGARFRIYDAHRLLQRYLALDPKSAHGQVLSETTSTMMEAQAHVERIYATLETATTRDMCTLALACEVLKEDERATALWAMIAKRAKDLTPEEAWEGCIALQRMKASPEVAALLLQQVTEAVLKTAPETLLQSTANLCQQVGQPARAEQLLKIGLSQAPKSPELWVSLALCYANNGNDDQAYRTFQTAIRYGALPILESDAAIAQVYLRLDAQVRMKKGVPQ